MKKIISIFLALITAVTLVSCGKKPDESQSDNKSDVKIDNKYNNDKLKWTSTHWYEGEETDGYLVKDGKTEYKILVPATLTEFITHAKDELTKFFAEATGITLETVTFAETGSKYISLGDTDAFAASGISVDKSALGRDGLRIVSRGDSIYIVGGSDRGVLYGVYDFLKLNFGYEVYYKDCYTLDTGVKNVKFRNYNVTDVPDVAYRSRAGILFNSTQENDDVMFAYRMRALDSLEEMLLPIYSKMGDSTSASNKTHNSSYYIPSSEYPDDPEFFAGNGQLCYTARGNSEKLEKMIDICAQKIEQSLRWYTKENYPYMNTAHLGIEDNIPTCGCDSCLAVKRAHNNADSAAVLMFVNRVGEKVMEWMNKPENAAYKRDDFTFTFFAYQSTLNPPFSVGPDGTVNASGDLKSPDGVKVKAFTAFSSLDYAHTTDYPANAAPLALVSDWAKFTTDGWAWTYGCFFNDYFCFFDMYSFYEDFYKILYKNGYQFTYAQFHSEQRGADSGFFTLANYLTSKMAWDSSLTMNDLIDDYFAAMYLDAAESMKKYFLECRLWFAREYGKHGWSESAISERPTSSGSSFDFGTVSGLFAKLDDAYADISKYKADTAVYNKLKTHIDIEWLFPAKVALTLYKNSYEEVRLDEMKSKFKSLCGSLGITRYGEASTDRIDSFLSTL